MILTSAEQERVARWVEEKFHLVQIDVIVEGVPEDFWERIDPWLAQQIQDWGEISRFPGSGSLYGQMVVKVVLGGPFSDPNEEPHTGLWSFSDLQRHGYNPLDDDDISDFAANQWEMMFASEVDEVFECLGTDVWIPRGISNANADGVSQFARIAGAVGFYVFDVQDKVVLGSDYDQRDIVSEMWAPLFTATTGIPIGRRRGPRG
jgi:hypothetical protein